MQKLILITLTVGFFACKKPPEADFKMQTDCFVGEEVFIENTSINATSYEWHLPEGDTLSSKDITYKATTAGTKKIKLIAMSKNGKHTDEKTLDLKVKPHTASVIFYISKKSPINSTTVYFLESSKEISGKTETVPDCENPGGNALFENIPEGSYDYLAGDGTYSWSGTITVAKGDCHVQVLE